MKNKKKGFTLVELLVVIAILAVLASVSVVGYVGFTTKAKQSACIQEATQARTAILAELTDGESKSFKLVGSNIELLTPETSAPTGNALKTEFGLTELPGNLEVAVDTDTFTYTSKDGYNATFKLDGNPVQLVK